MFKTCISCVFALFVMAVVGTLVWRTVKQESARPTLQMVGTLSNGPGSKQPVKAFTTTEMLGDYLLAAADRDMATVSRLAASRGAVTLEPGTKAAFMGISGPGQARVKIVSGVHSGQVLYVNYAMIQEPGS